MSKTATTMADGFLDHLWLHLPLWAGAVILAVIAGRAMRRLDMPLSLIIALVAGTAIAVAVFYGVQSVLAGLGRYDVPRLTGESPASFDTQALALRDVASALISCLVAAFLWIGCVIVARGRVEEP